MKTYPTVVIINGLRLIREMTATQRGRTELNLDREVSERAYNKPVAYQRQYTQYDMIGRI